MKRVILSASVGMLGVLAGAPFAPAAPTFDQPGYNSSKDLLGNTYSYDAFYLQGTGGMNMRNISFDGSKLTIAAQTTTIVLAPRPDGSFSSSSDWSVLNGTAYSRRLGWNPGTIAALGAGESIWIEKTGGSAQLKSYYAEYADPAGEPSPITQSYTYYGGIFGTGGSSTKWQWDQEMDHNAYAVNLADLTWSSSQTFTASYKIYIGDAAGNEVLGGDLSPKYASTTTTWTWTAPVPEPAALGLFGIAATALLAGRHRKPKAA